MLLYTTMTNFAPSASQLEHLEIAISYAGVLRITQ